MNNVVTYKYELLGVEDEAVFMEEKTKTICPPSFLQKMGCSAPFKMFCTRPGLMVKELLFRTFSITLLRIGIKRSP